MTEYRLELLEARRHVISEFRHVIARVTGTVMPRSSQ